MSLYATYRTRQTQQSLYELTMNRFLIVHKSISRSHGQKYCWVNAGMYGNYARFVDCSVSLHMTASGIKCRALDRLWWRLHTDNMK